MRSVSNRRVRLGLSKSALARILDLNARTIYDHEERGTVPVWLDYCLRAVEAESEQADKLIRDAMRHPDRPSLSPEEYHRRGQRMVAHRLAQWRRQRIVNGVDTLEVERLKAREEAERKEAVKLERIFKKVEDDAKMKRRLEARIAAQDALDKAAKAAKRT
jgi:hypothetical protein